MTALLEVAGLRKQFGGLTAVKDVSFTLAPGTVTGILGPNGAGKTTLFNLLTGFIQPDSGDIRFGATSLRGLAPHRVVNCGVSRTFQIARPFHQMTVLENVAVACLARRVRREHDGRYLDRARALLDQVGLGPKAAWSVDMAICAISRSRARWPPTRGCCCSMSRSPGWAPARSSHSRRSCASCATAASAS
jgi:branched-chain amino acid transport system ATP-binding protein